ncbi:carbamoyl phosphate synthase large subunit [candidate division LCP-89 bacterium B3_LCP]|uniref:Carbamoyl phosphate synthase large chain n=1 Tax=candidate division LCP-89 bacterium B3_LCP TaxID=2012998 RepID=A0A532V240_UNCL8|nr:MAG: carbamoyl phosphate synthase large subunit [candidate division LCP-89 bacterium B3_LCP]
MPHLDDIHSILVLGSGPIVIGQACEFDYSGTQAVRALKEEGLRVILINSNPATIMTDPSLADATYVEPLEPDMVERIIAQEKPDAVLPTMGGQTALNLAMALESKKVFDKNGIRLLGASTEAIQIAENRELFQEAMNRIGLDVPRGGFAKSVDEANSVLEETGFPVIIRPSFTLGGVGGSIVYNKEEFEKYIRWGLSRSPIGEILIEEALIGWKEFELEVMRDRADQCVVVCSIENFDPLGIHTGDSITVAPQQTLTDKEYQRMRDAAFAIIREIGVETGGSNIQFAVHPETGRMVVIEMNPRVSRSSALASKATGFPIARIAAKLAIGYRLDEISNAITRKTPACFEPALDYVVVKIPRWAFEKFPTVDQTLGSQMKSVGEVMAIGRSFPEALQKAIRSLEQDRMGLGADGRDVIASDHIEPHLLPEWRATLRRILATPRAENVFYLRHALKLGISIDEVAQITGVPPWFLDQLDEIIQVEKQLKTSAPSGRIDLTSLRQAIAPELLLKCKRFGYSDVQIAHLLNSDDGTIRRLREIHNIRPVHLPVDTCAAEFEAYTPYYYSSYERGEGEVRLDEKPRIIVLGSGPNRIGQGIEFDYCCVHASLTLRAEGYASIMVNCNPETVSTDYDISSRLYFEPITLEDVLEICNVEQPDGVIVQFGGQTPLKIAQALARQGIKILGTSPGKIAEAEDREKFGALLRFLDIPHPAYGIARNFSEAEGIADQVGYPVLVRPSFVLGGRAMEIVYNREGLEIYLRDSAGEVTPEHPVLIDRYIEDAFEFDLDAVSDSHETLICGIMQHIEEAGVHSGDSACVLPPFILSEQQRDQMKEIVYKLAEALEVVGLMNIQFAFKDGQMFVLEVNPRASRTIPFVSKATGTNWVQVATRCIIGRSLKEQGIRENLDPGHYAVKEVVFPFSRFEGINPFLGPEMRSTGEVMGIADTFSEAYSKALYAAGTYLPVEGNVFISVNQDDRKRMLPIARKLTDLGFRITATSGTKKFLNDNGVEAEFVYKVNEGRPNIVDSMKNGDNHLLINTPLGRESYYDERIVGETAYRMGLPLITTLSAAEAAIEAIEAIGRRPLQPLKLQELNQRNADG